MKLFSRLCTLVFAFTGFTYHCHTVMALGRWNSDRHPIPFKNGIPILVDGQGPFLFGLDTGASTAFYIAPALGTRLSIPVASHTHIHTTSTEAAGSAPPADVLRIPDLTVAGYVFHDVIGVAYSTTYDGTLGIGLFRHVLLTLDYPHNQLSISESHLRRADGKTAFAYLKDHAVPVVPVVLGGIHTQARLDTGAWKSQADVMVPVTMVSRLRLIKPMQAAGTVEDAVGRAYKRYTATLDGDLTIGSLVVHDPTLLISDFLPYVNLGGICGRLRIQLDEDHNVILLSLPGKTVKAVTTSVGQLKVRIPTVITQRPRLGAKVRDAVR